MFTSVVLSQPVIVTANLASKSERESNLNKQYTSLEKKLEKNITVALKKCTPTRSYTNRYCVVLWDEIEEISMKMNDIKTELMSLHGESYCWDELECREYDM